MTAGDDELLNWALNTLDAADSTAADSVHERIVRTLSEKHAGDQKEIALSLQSLARQIETVRNADSAFQFKQKSCETFLKFNMEQRRAGRSAIQAPAPPEASPPVPSELVERAKAAVSQSDQAVMERLITELIGDLERAHNRNQREIAAVLQRLSRQLEAASSSEDAFAFKQRTCEIMLKMSMAARRRNS